MSSKKGRIYVSRETLKQRRKPYPRTRVGFPDYLNLRAPVPLKSKLLRMVQDALFFAPKLYAILREGEKRASAKLRRCSSILHRRTVNLPIVLIPLCVLLCRYQQLSKRPHPKMRSFALWGVKEKDMIVYGITRWVLPPFKRICTFPF